MKTVSNALEQLSINTIRTLAMDAVQAANSGHPGTPMALAPVAYSLWTRWLRFDPAHPDWANRDRFVLSCGHASMLLYSLLHLSGVRRNDGKPSVSLDDIRNFRQLHSPCAGHPEFGEVVGAETTTGPLGQGVANSVGMAIASRWMAARFNRPGLPLFNNRVFALCSDGDLMEGISGEAASLAGHLGLGNLCWIWDDNQITIEGSTDLAFSENIRRRFEAMGWETAEVLDANDLDALDREFSRFDSGLDRPLLLVVKSVIGYGAPTKQNTAAAHGSPLGNDEIRGAKLAYGWPVDAQFLVPPEVPRHFSETLGRRGQDQYRDWLELQARLADSDPALAGELEMIRNRCLPPAVETTFRSFVPAEKPAATRISSGKVLNAVAGSLPWLIGGSADLAGSNNSLIEDPSAGHLSREMPGGRNLHFGVREHAMAAIANGMALSGLRPYAATFFVFTDYMRPAMRLSALMQQPVIWLLTHDSIGLGEDGPTHQPVEHLAAVRAIPNLLVIRPADSMETAAAWQTALQQSRRPTAIVLTRQNVPFLKRGQGCAAGGPGQGAYVLWQADGECNLVLMGSGSEVAICLEAALRLQAEGHCPRVVSFPSWELFAEQPGEYRESVLPAGIPARVAVEAGLAMGWREWIGGRGEFVGMTGFGASAPAEVLYRHFGITVDAVVAAAHRTLAR